ncbi:MAG: flagellar export chaperone FliS [Magnetococcales bacterium]|nr:flagellar export chaperone FliS [Magnetococcales bacterium]
MSYALRSYKASRTNTASREDLLILLYEGAIRFLERSITEMEAGNLAPHKEFLRRGIAIIAELQNTLNFEKGGDLAIQLFELYGYMLTLLTKANMEQEMSHIGKVITQMETLLEGWREAVRQVKASGGLAQHAAAEGVEMSDVGTGSEAPPEVAAATGFAKPKPSPAPARANPYATRPSAPTLSRSL